MKMRRSIWRKLAVIVFAILTVVSVYFTVKNYIPTTKTSGLEIIGTPAMELVEVEGEEYQYRCTVKFTVKNTTQSSVAPVYFHVKFQGVPEEQLIASPVSALAAGKTYEVEESFLTNYSYKYITIVRVTLKNLSSTYTIYGPEAAKGTRDYIKAMIAISVILFGIFIYTCVALYMSPKKKVHSKHRHHHHSHHHHHHSTDSSASSTPEETKSEVSENNESK